MRTTGRRRRLRVAIYAPHFSEYSYRLAAGLSRESDVRLVLEREDANRELATIPTSRSFELRIRDLRIRRVGAIGLPMSFLDVVAFRPDVVHCHESPDYWTWALMEVLRRSSVPQVLTVHDAMPHSQGGSGTSHRKERLRGRMRGAASLVTLHSESCVADFRRASPDYRGDVTSAMHGVLMAPPENVPTAQPTPGRILFFGRMWPYKGLDVLLDAVDMLSTRRVPHQVVVAGSGPEMTRLAPRMERMPTIVAINRYISPADTVALFQSAAVVALPYRDATQSGVLACAFGNHRPVVASATGGIPEIVREGVNGLLVPPGDHAALADALERVITSTTLEAMLAEGARETALGPMNWSHIADDMVRSYRNLVGL
jgi:glycosyltransferase involved in cell wall biosynthesis